MQFINHFFLVICFFQVIEASSPHAAASYCQANSTSSNGSPSNSAAYTLFGQQNNLWGPPDPLQLTNLHNRIAHVDSTILQWADKQQLLEQRISQIAATVVALIDIFQAKDTENQNTIAQKDAIIDDLRKQLAALQNAQGPLNPNSPSVASTSTTQTPTLGASATSPKSPGCSALSPKGKINKELLALQSSKGKGSTGSRSANQRE